MTTAEKWQDLAQAFGLWVVKYNKDCWGLEKGMKEDKGSPSLNSKWEEETQVQSHPGVGVWPEWLFKPHLASGFKLKETWGTSSVSWQTA